MTEDCSPCPTPTDCFLWLRQHNATLRFHDDGETASVRVEARGSAASANLIEHDSERPWLAVWDAIQGVDEQVGS